MSDTTAPYHESPFWNMKKTSRKFFSDCFFIMPDSFGYSICIFSLWITDNFKHESDSDATMKKLIVGTGDIRPVIEEFPFGASSGSRKRKRSDSSYRTFQQSEQMAGDSEYLLPW